MPVARQRALERLNDPKLLEYGLFLNAASVADAIWPGHGLRAQGAGAAASRILTRLKADGLVRWDSSGTDWGWKITPAGRVRLLKGEPA